MTPSALNSNKPTVTLTPLLHNPLIQADAPFVPMVANDVSGTLPSATSYLPPRIPHPPVLTTRDSSQVTVFESFRQAADQGQARAQYSLGVIYSNERYVAHDYAKAVKYYQLAADQGHDYANLYLGHMHANGHGVAKDYAETFKCYQLAADQGNVQAQRYLGELYRDGRGIPRDAEKAMRCIWKANGETDVIQISGVNDNMLQYLPDLFEEFGGYGQINERPPVRELSLSNSTITDIGAPVIALILKRTQTLTKLTLRNTDITCQGMEIILDALKNHNVSVIDCVFPETSSATDETLRKLSEQNTAIKNIMDGFDENYPTYVPKPFDILPMEVLRQLLQTIAVVHTKIPAPPDQSTISSIITSIRSMFVSRPATTRQVMDNVYNVFMSDPGRASYEKG